VRVDHHIHSLEVDDVVAKFFFCLYLMRKVHFFCFIKKDEKDLLQLHHHIRARKRENLSITNSDHDRTIN